MPTLFEELPYAYVITSSKNSQVCHYCCKNDDGAGTMRRCSVCKFAHYCDANCQKRAWPDHCRECSSLKKIHPKVPMEMSRHIARIIFKQQDNPSDQESNSGKRTFGQLMSHKDEIKNDPIQMEHFMIVCRQLAEYVDGEQLPSTSDLLEIFGKLCVNSFCMTDQDSEKIGVGLYLELSILDHSCDPDAVVIFIGQKAILNYIRSNNPEPYPNYKNVSTTYIDLMSPSWERQRQLKEQYYFHCTCTRCNDPYQDQLMQALACTNRDCDGFVLISADNDETSSCQKCCATIEIEPGRHMMKYLEWQLEELMTLQKKGDFSTVYDRAVELIKEANDKLHCVNVYYVRLLGYACLAALMLERWQKALEYSKLELPAHRLHIPHGHPAMTLQLMKVGKVLRYLVELEEAEKYLQLAVDNAKLSHCEKHPIYTNALELLASCREERIIRSLQKI